MLEDVHFPGLGLQDVAVEEQQGEEVEPAREGQPDHDPTSRRYVPIPGKLKRVRVAAELTEATKANEALKARDAAKAADRARALEDLEHATEDEPVIKKVMRW